MNLELFVTQKKTIFSDFFFSNDKQLDSRGSQSQQRGDVQDFYTLRTYCLENGIMFEDPEFQATDESIQFSRRLDRRIEWLRPMEVSSHFILNIAVR